MINIHKSWRPILNHLYRDPLKKLFNEILTEISYQPSRNNIFRVFRKPVKDIKVVILKEAPYPIPIGNGLAYGVDKNTSIPVELNLLLVESNAQERGSLTSLEYWEEQGVFLLHTSLTTETGHLNNHRLFWEDFIKKVIQFISKEQPCIWLVWGEYNACYIQFILKPFFVKNYDKVTIKMIPSNEDWNYILQAPSVLSKEWIGNNHFIYTNEILKKTKNLKINW